ncbi:neural cell adhesion molecule 2-like [Antedon mediterranea]|uniref:neural cell adhesion molecule 2-like n=1 Tax=Antedon mediterranea TaxID=105859 RepID=UPI003AF87CBE
MTDWRETYHMLVYYIDRPTISGPFTLVSDNTNSVTFFCTWGNIHPNEEPKVSWLFEESVLNTTGGRYALKDDKNRQSIVVMNISLSDFGRYACHINVETNMANMSKTSNYEDLTQMPNCEPLLITGYPFTNVEEGEEEVKIQCDVKFRKHIKVIIWNELDDAGDDVNIAVVNSMRRVNGRYKLTEESGKSNLVIKSPNGRDSGKMFTCIVVFVDGTTAAMESPSRLNVWYLHTPQIMISKSNVYIGEPISMICNVSSNWYAQVHITWFKDNAIFTNDNNNYSYRLQIPAASLLDNGIYQCRIRSDDLEKISTGIYVSVTDVFIDAKLLYESDTGVVTCIADGHPPPSLVRIYYNGEKVAEGDSSTIYTMDTSVCGEAIMCYTKNARMNNTTQLQTDEHCKEDFYSPSTLSSTVLIIIAAMSAFIFGAVPTCVITRFIYIKRIRTIHCEYRNPRYQELKVSALPAIYKELNKVTKVDNGARPTTTTRKEQVNTDSNVAKSIYENISE